MLLTTACADEDSSGDGSFAPLQVHYTERFSAAGRTSGGYLKREGKPKDREVLVSRLIDRPIRPMIQPGWTHSTQVLTWVMSYDGQHSPEPLAITAAGAALAISGARRRLLGGACCRLLARVPLPAPQEVPQQRTLPLRPGLGHVGAKAGMGACGAKARACTCFWPQPTPLPACPPPPTDVPLRRAVAGARVGLLPGRGFVVNPTVAEMAGSSLDLVMAGTSEAVLMIEGFCEFLTEEQMLEVGRGVLLCWVEWRVCGTGLWVWSLEAPGGAWAPRGAPGGAA